MYNYLPEKLLDFAGELPYPLYVVGGRVRDFLAGLYSDGSDTDLCAPADAEDFAARAEKFGFSVDATYKHTGTLKLSLEGQSYEFTCFRTDEYVRGGHTPVRTYFTEDINLDARRRDFKCNAVYYDIAARRIVDPLGGTEDIDNRRVDTVTDPDKVFGEDGLRLMRLARICGQTGFLPSAGCIISARKNSELIRDVSAERIFTELMLILSADKKYGMNMGHYNALKILKNIGILQILLPELCEGEGVVQRKEVHKYDVLEHSLRAAAYADESIRLAALLHDVGKPYCLKTAGNFVEHEEEGARIAGEICERLKAPKKLTQEVMKLTEVHMYDFRGDAKENKVRKFIIENLEYFDKILLLKQADFSACADDFSRSPLVAKFDKIYGRMLKEGVPFTLKELNLKGGDLLELGIPEQEIGKVLNCMLGDCAIKLVPNVNEKLVTRARKVYLPAYLAAANAAGNAENASAGNAENADSGNEENA